MNYKVLVAATLVATVVSAAEVDTQLPQPWFKNGAPPAAEQCLAGVDAALEARGTPNITLKCDSEVEGFVGAMQNFAANNYRGQRIRFSALIKGEGVEGWGGIWMRVDDVNKPGASFDNMAERAVKGTADWTPYSIVLDASNEAQGIYFGTLMSGKGQLWISDLRFEVVGTDVPVTGRTASAAPGNLQLAR
jgi:hypothetical protein